MNGPDHNLHEELRRNRARIAELEQQLNVDDLVGLGNRRALRQAYDRLRARFEKAGAPRTAASLAILDLVGLKEVNEEQGYAEGDRALVRFAEDLRRAFLTEPLGVSTVVTRLGGDEFVVLAQGAGSAEIERRLALLEGPPASDALAPSGNAGYTVAVVDVNSDESLEEVIARADRILVARKRRRRAERRTLVRAGSVGSVGTVAAASRSVLTDES